MLRTFRPKMTTMVVVTDGASGAILRRLRHTFRQTFIVLSILQASASFSELSWAQGRAVEDHNPPKISLSVLAKLDHPEASAIAWSPDGKYLVSTGLLGPGTTFLRYTKNYVAVWDVFAKRIVGKTERDNAASDRALGFAADGTRVLFAHPPNPPATAALSIWNVERGVIEGYVEGPYPASVPRAITHNTVSIIATTQFGQTLAAIFNAHRPGDPIWILDKESLQVRSTLATPQTLIRSAALSSDGRWLALGRYDGQITILDLSRAATHLTFKAHGPAVGAVAFSPDNSRLVSASGTPRRIVDQKSGAMIDVRDEDPLRVWDVATGKFLKSYRGDFDSIWSVAWSPNGRYIATAGKGSRMRIWDALSPVLLSASTEFKREALAVSFESHTGHLAASGTDGIIILEINEKAKAR